MQKLKESFKSCVTMLMGWGELGLTLAMMLVFAFAGLMGRPAEVLAAGGATSFTLGVASGTSSVLICSGAGTYYMVKLGSAATGGYVKVFNTAVGSAALGAETNLIDMVVASSGAASGGTLSNIQGAPDAREGGIKASTAISAIKSAAADIWFVRATCD